MVKPLEEKLVKHIIALSRQGVPVWKIRLQTNVSRTKIAQIRKSYGFSGIGGTVGITPEQPGCPLQSIS